MSLQGPCSCSGAGSRPQGAGVSIPPAHGRAHLGILTAAWDQQQGRVSGPQWPRGRLGVQHGHQTPLCCGPQTLAGEGGQALVPSPKPLPVLSLGPSCLPTEGLWLGFSTRILSPGFLHLMPGVHVLRLSVQPGVPVLRLSVQPPIHVLRLSIQSGASAEVLRNTQCIRPWPGESCNCPESDLASARFNTGDVPLGWTSSESPGSPRPRSGPRATSLAVRPRSRQAGGGVPLEALVP